MTVACTFQMYISSKFNVSHSQLITDPSTAVGLPRRPWLNIECNINIGIKHDFPFINIRKVPRGVLKTVGVANVNE